MAKPKPEPQKDLPAFKKGWDVKNHAYDGVYAIKRGDKIYGNTGVIRYLGKTTKENEMYRYGGLTEPEFRKAEQKFKANGHETIVMREKYKAGGELERLMIRVE
jgi:hypothetical protein